MGLDLLGSQSITALDGFLLHSLRLVLHFAIWTDLDAEGLLGLVGFQLSVLVSSILEVEFTRSIPLPLINESREPLDVTPNGLVSSIALLDVWGALLLAILTLSGC